MLVGKVISLLQPWASLVILGHKKVETRSWQTPYRGRLLIHASAGKAGRKFAEAEAISRYIPDFNTLPFGALIGEVELVDMIRFGKPANPEEAEFLDGITLEEQAFGDFSAGRWGWVLEWAFAYEEVLPAKGKLGLWEW
jgi:hypothetical protein